jgi:hypothetical protein
MHLFSRRKWVERGGGGIVCEMVVLDMETYISYNWLCIHLSYHTIVPVATFSNETPSTTQGAQFDGMRRDVFITPR